MKLTIAEADQQDVGRSIARISSEAMDVLSLNSGDIIEVNGKALASVRRANAEDSGLGLIRVDSTLRRNAQVSLSEEVEVKKVECSPALEVFLAPLQAVKFSEDPTEYFHSRLIDKPLKKNQTVVIDVMGNHLQYIVTKLNPKSCAVVTQSTKINISENIAKDPVKIPDISYEDIGGLKREIELIREMIELPMKHPELFERLGIGAPKGVLLTGPPGTGKTLLAKAVASETDANFYSIAGPEIISKFYGESEKQIRDIFEDAEKNHPAIIFIDEIDSIAPKRGEGKDQTEKRVVAQLLTLMDGIKSRGNVVVIAATNRPDDIDEALRRPGRFDREIKILPPDDKGRKEILQIHTRGMPLAEDVDLDAISRKTHGFTGADIEALCKEAAMKTLKPYMRDLQKLDMQEKIPTNVLEKIVIHKKHFDDALQMVEPSALREVLIERPSTTWNDIGGLAKVKKELQEAIELPLKRPELYKQAGINPPKGILLYGPPGTGKTLLAKAVAHESEANFISVKGPELVSKWVGESEKHIREIFKKARQVAPTIIFFDEFDAISKVRGQNTCDGGAERMVNQLLTEIDGVEDLEKVTIIAATNRADLIDPSLVRPGRIELKVEIGIPNKVARKQIFEVHTKNMPLIKDVKLSGYIEKTNNWTGAEIESLCREAGVNGIREAVAKNQDNVTISSKNFRDAFIEVERREKKKPIN